MFTLLCLVLCTGVSFGSKIIDLTFEIGPEIPKYPSPGFDHFEIETIKQGYKLNMNWIATQKISSDEHSGTHFDAPIAFNPHGASLDKLPLNKLFGPVAVIDISGKVKKNSIYELTAKDVEDFVYRHGMFSNNSIVLVHTGWASRWPDQLQYFGNADENSKSIYPGTSLEAIEKLVSYKESHSIHIETLGIDTPSLDFGPSVGKKVTRYIAKQNICLISQLNGNLKYVPAKGSLLMIMPMKIKGGTGSPARVFARLPSKDNYV